jgi:hypothetical protein
MTTIKELLWQECLHHLDLGENGPYDEMQELEADLIKAFEKWLMLQIEDYERIINESKKHPGVEELLKISQVTIAQLRETLLLETTNKGLTEQIEEAINEDKEVIVHFQSMNESFLCNSQCAKNPRVCGFKPIENGVRCDGYEPRFKSEDGCLWRRSC